MKRIMDFLSFGAIFPRQILFIILILISQKKTFCTVLSILKCFRMFRLYNLNVLCLVQQISCLFFQKTMLLVNVEAAANVRWEVEEKEG